MQHCAAEPSTEDRTDSDGEKGKAHVSALLSGGRKLGDVFVILWGLGDFAEGENKNGEHGSPVAGPQTKNQPGQSGNESAENHGAKRRERSNQMSSGQSEANHNGGVDAQDAFHTSMRVNEGVGVAGQQGGMLPENHPIAA